MESILKPKVVRGACGRTGGPFWLGQNEVAKVWGGQRKGLTQNLVQTKGRERRDRTPGKEEGARAKGIQVRPH